MSALCPDTSPAVRQLRVLAAIDQPYVSSYIVPRLREFGFLLHVYEDTGEALKELETSTYDLVIVVRDLGFEETLSVAKEAMGAAPRVPVAMLTTQAVGYEAIEASVFGVQLSFQIYPGCEGALGAQLRCCVERHKLRRNRQVVSVDISTMKDSTAALRLCSLQMASDELRSASNLYAKQASKLESRQGVLEPA